MRKLFLIAKRDYLAAVRTKAFVIGLLAAPILLGGSFFGSVLLRQQPAKQVRRIAVLDRTGMAAQAVVQQIEQQNQHDAFDKNTGAQIMPKYEFEIEPSSSKDADTQRLMLSNRVREKQLFGFLEIQPTSVRWYSNEGGFGETGRWLAGLLNDGLRRIRLRDLGIRGEQADQLLKAVPLESMKLFARDKTGRIVPARKRGMTEGFATPFVVAMLFFMIVLSTAAPMLTAVAEDKAQRVFEMLLVSATPFELIAGKVLAAVGTALTSSVVYVVAALVLLQGLAMLGFAPLQVVPWFFLYLIAEVILLASVATALGAACNSIRDAENLKMIPLFPVVMPMLFLTAVLQDPNGGLATAMSFVPLFTPILMLVRQASPSAIPAWQPVVGLIDVFVTTMAFSWMASRIFRIALLFQGKTPTAVELIRWGLSD